MGLLTLLQVASMPVLQVLIISFLGAFLATDYLKILPHDARNSLNKIVFVTFTPSLIFASLAKTVRIEDIISWWFMPVNIGLTFVFGAFLGWLIVKLLRPEPYIGDLIMAVCSAGNLGNILFIIIPAICKEDGNPFGDKTVCSTVGSSYVAMSMALGSFYIWTYAYHLIRRASTKHKAAMLLESAETSLKKNRPNDDLEGNGKSPLLLIPEEDDDDDAKQESTSKEETSIEMNQTLEVLHQLWEEIKTPPIVAGILGFIVGAVTWLRHLLIGEGALLRVIYDCIVLLGDGTIPCITLILGGNLTKGIKQARLKASITIGVIVVRYILLPAIGILVVKAASSLGFLASDPLYRFILMIQFTLPPAMNIGTMTQLFGVAQEECSVLFLWTYLAAAFALTGWSAIFMWILST